MSPTVVAETAVTVADLRIETLSGLPVINGVSFEVPPGQVLGLVGESGSGKTTTALAVLGFVRPGMRFAGGRVTIAGEMMDLADQSAARQLRGRLVSLVPQDPGASLNPSLRIRDAIGDMLRGGQDRRTIRNSVRVALERVNLPAGDDFARRYPHQLSGGQQQRTLITMAFISEPPLIVLDEPTTGLDVITQALVLDEIRRLHRERSTAMLYVSHDLSVVAAIADRVAVMYGGQIVEEGPTAQLLTHPLHPYTRGLVASIPDHVVPRQLHGIPGVAVGVSDRPPGCPFEPRCPQRQPRCSQTLPASETVAERRSVRCFEWRSTPPLEAAQPPVRFGRAREIPVLVVERLKAVHRSRGRAIVAAHDVSFVVHPGESLALVGESGSGKTTIARCIAGLHRPSGGQISLHGETVAPRAQDRSRETRRRCQIVFQNPYDSLNPRRRIGDQISWSAQVLRELSPREARSEAARLMELVRLPTGLLEQFPRELSGGERQRVAIARAVVAQPDILICDEITSELDVSVQAAVIDLLFDLRATLELAVLFISHDLGLVASIADRVIVLENGLLCEQGSIDDVLRNPAHEYTQRLLAAAPRLPEPTPATNATISG